MCNLTTTIIYIYATVLYMSVINEMYVYNKKHILNINTNRHDTVIYESVYLSVIMKEYLQNCQTSSQILVVITQYYS